MIGKRSVQLDDYQNVEKALRKLKKKVQDSGVLMELRDKEAYIKPTTRRKLKKAAARKRWEKYLRSQQLPKQVY